MSVSVSIMKLSNSIMKTILNSPLHGMMSNRIMIITFQGRKTGKTYSTPVSYIRQDHLVTCFTHAPWWKNIRDGAPVQLLLRGKPWQGHAVAEAEDTEQITAGLREMFINLPGDARFYGVTINSNGEPDMNAVQKAAENTVMIRVTLESPS